MNKTLYSLAKAYGEASLHTLFSENDLICVLGTKGVPYYVSIVENAFAAYCGEKGLTGYLALSLEEDDASELEYVDLQQAQECLLAILGSDASELDPTDLKEVEESGVDFGTTGFPQFRSKLQFQFPWYLTDEETEDLILIMRSLLFAKEYFSAFKKHGKASSFSAWLDSLGLKDQEKKEYIPCITADGEGFSVTAKVLQDEAYGFEYPQAYFTNEEKKLTFKRMRAKPGKVYYHMIGLLPEPMMGKQSDRPVYPIFSLIYDPQSHMILDVYIVEDYEKEHGLFIARLLEIFENEGKPQAIHCFGKRTLTLLSQMGKQIGIMVVEGTQKEEMEKIVMEMLENLYAEHNHHHDHEHGPDCSCHHDHDHDHHH